MRRFFLIISLIMAGVSTPAFSQSIESMGAGDLILNLRARIVDIKETERTLNQNTLAAEDNREEAGALRTLDQSLVSRSTTYDTQVADHNANVQAYNERCLGRKLPEDIYTECLGTKQTLESQKTRLDRDGDALVAEHNSYNERVRDLNQRESSRATGAQQLLSTYERLDNDIRRILLRLYDIAVQRDQNGFAEDVRQCTKRDNLDAVYACMSDAFNT